MHGTAQTSRRERCEARREAMKPREKNQIHGKFAEIKLSDRVIECTLHPAHQSGRKMVEVSVSGGRV